MPAAQPPLIFARLLSRLSDHSAGGHHVRTLHADFAFAVFIGIINLDTTSQNGRSHAAGLTVFVAVGRDKRGDSRTASHCAP